jgi:hypothetical protein
MIYSQIIEFKFLSYCIEVLCLTGNNDTGDKRVNITLRKILSPLIRNFVALFYSAEPEFVNV